MGQAFLLQLAYLHVHTSVPDLVRESSTFAVPAVRHDAVDHHVAVRLPGQELRVADGAGRAVLQHLGEIADREVRDVGFVVLEP
eukprot:8811151-Pyramimonas_sp.AAC.1